MKIGADTMAAVGYDRTLPADDPHSLIDVDVPIPELRPHDLLVEIRAVSVNPVDVKQRSGSDPQGATRIILGFDAAGIVREVGDAATLSSPAMMSTTREPSIDQGRMQRSMLSTNGSWDTSHEGCPSLKRPLSRSRRSRRGRASSTSSS